MILILNPAVTFDALYYMYKNRLIFINNLQSANSQYRVVLIFKYQIMEFENFKSIYTYDKTVCECTLLQKNGTMQSFQISYENSRTSECVRLRLRFLNFLLVFTFHFFFFFRLTSFTNYKSIAITHLKELLKFLEQGMTDNSLVGIWK